MKPEENHARTEAERGYNERDLIRSLLASVESTEDRERLRWLDSQLRQLSALVRNKMGLRGRRPAR
jgi:hypothetical protein